MDKDILSHCAELDRCNQRGGRMLSIFDLLEAGTLNLDLAAWLMARLSRGPSFIVGASPGGAGKTTIMCALLNLVPPELRLLPATADVVYEAGRIDGLSRSCFICHEISPGRYYAYLWSQVLRDYCDLSDKKHMLATNLHADDLDEAREQICRDNGVSVECFFRFEILLFLRLTGRMYEPRRDIVKVYSGDGHSRQLPVYDVYEQMQPVADQLGYHAEPDFVRACRDFLEQHYNAGIRTIEQTRQAVVQFYTASD